MKHSYSVTTHISKIRDPTVHQTLTRIVWADALPVITIALMDSISDFPTTRKAANPTIETEAQPYPPTKDAPH